MTWSQFKERPSEELLNQYQDQIPDEIFEAIDYNFDTERDFIEDHAKNEYPDPSQAPQRPTTASMIGRFAKNNADTFQNIFIKNNVLEQLEEGDGAHEDVMTYIGLKALRNGY
jgi:hypothetical protein